jgi:hypothetical protein
MWNGQEDGIQGNKRRAVSGRLGWHQKHAYFSSLACHCDSAILGFTFG